MYTIYKQLVKSGNYTIPNLATKYTEFSGCMEWWIFKLYCVSQAFFHFTGKTSLDFSNNTIKLEIL